MPLITTIETAKLYVKLNYNNSSSALADMAAADTRFLLPVLGQTLYDAILEDIELDTPLLADLTTLCYKAVAPLAYWMDLPTMQTKITDNGISTFDNASQMAAHRWEYEALRDSLADKGCFAMETLLQHLFDNAETYEWTLPDDYKLIFLTGKEFNKYFPLYQPYRTFESMRPVLRKVEDEYIKSVIGEDFFEELRDNDAPTTAEAAAIKLLKKTAANFTIKAAIEMLPVKLSSYGFTVLLSANEKPPQGEGDAPDNKLSLMHASAERSGQSYLLQLQSYLNTNASETVFATYYASVYYTSPATTAETVNPNSTRNGIFRL